MKKLLAKIRKLLRDRRTRQIITRFVSVTAAIVVFVTTYALVLPAITMESEAYCGIPAHQHDDSCFTEELVCGEVESPGHVHTESCYTVTPVLACTEEVHTHGENCYDEDGELVCEVPEHQHDDDCFDEERVLTCEIPESEGHQHTADCYEKVLTCGKEVHVHSTACYEEPASDVSDIAVVASTASTGSTASAAGASTGVATSVDEYEFENAGESANSGEAEDASSALTATDEAAAGSTDAPGSIGAAEIDADATTSSTNAAESITGEAGITADGEYVPQLEPLNFPAVLSPSTGIYYHPVADGEVIEDSTQIANDGWNRIPGNEEHGDKVELGKSDLLRVYLSYAISAGSLNTTNPVARYRLPGNLHLTDSQVNAINANVNGIAGQYISYDTLEITDTDKYYAYLGVEAVEGSRTPDQDAAEYARELARRTGDGSEYISAVVRVENVYSELTGEYLGQDLVFTFTPYSIGKNQHEYDRTGQPTKAGEAIEGWLTLDFNTSQVDWNEPAVTTFEREEEVATAEDQTVDDETGEATEAVETVQRSEQTSEIVFVAEGIDENGNRIHEISTELTVVEETVVETKDAVNDNNVNDQSDENSGEGLTEDVAAATTEDASVEDQEQSEEKPDESNTGETADTADSTDTADTSIPAEETAETQYVDGTLTATGDGYKITLDYTADARIPADAKLNVTEITEASDKEAYEACLEAARQSVSENAADGGNQTVDKAATRFFDIEIVAEEMTTETATAASDDPAAASEEAVADTVAEEAVDNDSSEDAATVEEITVENDAEVDDTNSTEGEESATGKAEESSESTTGGFRKIEPAAPVSVRIELLDMASKTAASKTVDEADSHAVDNENPENPADQQSEPTVLHFTEDGLETIESNLMDAGAIDTAVDDNQEVQDQNNQSQEKVGTADGTANGTQAIQFEASSFSIYGVVYTTLSTTVLTASGETYEITVTYDGEAGIPDDAVLEAEEILEGTTAYEDYLVKTVEALSDKQSDNQKVLGDSNTIEDNDDAEVTTENGEDTAVVEDSEHFENGEESENATVLETTIVSEKAETPRIGFARFFDIRIMSNGQKIEPTAPVKVAITYQDAVDVGEDGEILAVHFAEDGTEVIATETDEANQEISFVQGSFSVTGTVVSVGSNNWPNNGSYVLYTQIDGNYYAIKHDGTLEPVVLNGSNLSFPDADPLFFDRNEYAWALSSNYNYMTGVTNTLLSYTDGGTDYYLNPHVESGISNSTTDPARYISRNSSNVYGSYVNNRYYIKANGTEAIKGESGNTNAIPIYFANNFDSIRKVTVHFVDREGNPIQGVTYNGPYDNYIKQNPNEDNGTFAIPYNWNGVTGEIEINLSTDFSKQGYTYASTHLAGSRNGTPLTHEGLVIDAVLKESGGNLYYSTDRGDNKKYGGLSDYNFNNYLNVPQEYTGDGFNSTLSGNGGMTQYVSSNTDKEVYVILDPTPPASSSGGSNGGNLDVTDPRFEKKLVSNHDGTYTLSLSVTGYGKNTAQNPKANVVFVVDTSSSMVNNMVEDTGNTRLYDTQQELKKFAQQLLNYNSLPGRDDDTIELAMVSFDGGVVSNGIWYKTYNGSDGFSTQIDRLTAANMHTGTDWEDGLKEAYSLGTAKLSEGEPTFVVFFTDGEPSNYTNFHGPGENNGGRGYRYWYSYFLSREAAKDEARAIVSSGLQFYSVYAYNKDTSSYNNHGTAENGSTFLQKLVNYGYNAERPDTFYRVNKTSDLKEAFTSILNKIVESVGTDNVIVNDNITSLTSVGVSIINGNYTGFKYTKSGGSYGTDQEWSGAPSATYDSSGVHWDLSSLGILEDGVTYKVSFVVWPSQEAYDWVADLNNGIKGWDDLVAANIQDHFLREPDASMPSGYRYEVATNPNSYNQDGTIAHNLITYTKTHKEIISTLPAGASLNTPTVVTDQTTGTKTTTTYTQNADGTYTMQVVTEARTAFGPPDLNMGLEDTVSAVEKIWDVGEQKELLAAYLYSADTGQSREISIPFQIIQSTVADGSGGSGSGNAQQTIYKIVNLGWKTVSGVTGYHWVGTTQNVEVGGQTVPIGTRWREDFDIAVGLMLSETQALARGIDIHDTDEEDPVHGKYKKVYLDPVNKTSPYYVLEVGHDYDIKEPTVNYRFDFLTERSHPMLVDGVLKDVTIDYESHKILGISPEGNDTSLSSLSARNAIRGELTLDKIVWDYFDHVVNNCDEVFPITVTLTNQDGKFYIGASPDEENVPWYGVERTVNSETEYCYYHKYDGEGNIVYVTESEAAVNGDYDHYGLKDGYYGNIMEYDTSAESDHKKAWITINVKPGEKWSIANIPNGTTYVITEAAPDGFEFRKAEEIETDGSIVTRIEKPKAPSITGTIRTSHTTKVEFTNKIKPPVFIKKVSADNSSITADGAEFDLYREFEKQTPTEEEIQNNGLILKFGKYLQKVNASKIVSGTYQLEDDQDDETDETVHGYVMMGNLSTGDTFYLVETKAPDGYNSPVFDYIKLTFGTAVDPPGSETTKAVVNWLAYVENTETHAYETTGTAGRAFVGSIATDHNDGTIDAYTVIVANNPGFELPSSGGPGTKLIYLAGALLTLAAGLLLMHRGKRIGT